MALKKVEAGFRTWRDPFVIKWLSKTSIKKYAPSVGSVSFYDEKSGEDVELIPLSQTLEWNVDPVSGEKGQYNVMADGVIVLEVDEKMLSRLKKAGNMVDHVVEFTFKDHTAESDEDFEFIENSNIELDLS